MSLHPPVTGARPLRILIVHQRYRIRGGEDAMVDATADLLRRRGHEVRMVTRDSSMLAAAPLAKIRAAVEGIYSFPAAARMRRLLADPPDLVHVHNLHPEFSPSVLSVCRRAGVPVVMTCHNYRLVCPTGMHMRRGRVCERCLGGREHWCLLTNCRGNWFESAAYALRAIIHRRLGLFKDNVTRFIAVSHFVRSRLVAEGYPASRIAVVPNWVAVPRESADPGEGSYAAFAGRFSPQKGIMTLLDAASRCGVPLKAAGDFSTMPEAFTKIPARAVFTGRLDGRGMMDFYRGARFAVVPSECLEPFGLVAAEAMSHGLPVLCAAMGGLSEIVDHGVTGLLFSPGNAADLARNMKRLWDDPELCRRLGTAAREKVMDDFSEDLHYERLMEVYGEALRTPAPMADRPFATEATRA